MRHRRMAAPINSIKHYVPQANIAITSGNIVNFLVVDAVVAPAISNAFDVTEGAVIKAVYVEIWLASNAGAASESQFVLTIEKKRDQEADMTNTQALNLGSYPNKKNILYTTQGILGSLAVTGTVPVVRNWVLIPKGKQRFGSNDQFMINVAAVGGMQMCGITTYKEYR